MKISIRKSKHQKESITIDQVNFASNCVLKYMRENTKAYWSYEGLVHGVKMGCDVYKTKTTISAIVWLNGEDNETSF